MEGASRIGITDVGLGLEYGGLAGGGNPEGNTFYGTTQRRYVSRYTGRFAASYVTGSHTLKAGFTVLRYNLGRDGDLQRPRRDRRRSRLRLPQPGAHPGPAVGGAVRDPGTHDEQRDLRPGSVGGQKAHAQPGPAVRQPAGNRTGIPSAGGLLRAGARLPGGRQRTELTRISTRGSAGPTTCSATARPPSKHRSAGSCPGWSPRSATPRAVNPPLPPSPGTTRSMAPVTRARGTSFPIVTCGI